MKRLALVSLLMISAAVPVFAERLPMPVKADNRIRHINFEKDNVVALQGTRGIATMIVFGDGEKVATVALGDTVSWEVIPDAAKTILFVKPLEKDAATNMNVVTNKRIYNFSLHSNGVDRSNPTFKVVFHYPDEEWDARLLTKAREMAANPGYKALMQRPSVNRDYAYKGSEETKPDGAFDDGAKTYFHFAGEVPAIFLVQADGSETLVNYRREGDAIIVDKVAAQFTMRHGDLTSCVFNLRAVKAPARKSVVSDLKTDEPIPGAN